MGKRVKGAGFAACLSATVLLHSAIPKPQHCPHTTHPMHLCASVGVHCACVWPCVCLPPPAGKTLVYALPLICIALQDEMLMPLESGEGPLGLIICPSRELANQTVEVITQYTESLTMVRKAGGPDTVCGIHNQRHLGAIPSCVCMQGSFIHVVFSSCEDAGQQHVP